MIDEDTSVEPAWPQPDLDRARILRRFEVWLDEVLAQETPPAGVAQEILDSLQNDPGAAEQMPASADFYNLWAGFTALSEETRLQGRSFKALQESLQPMQGLVDSVSQTLHHYEQTVERQEQQTRDDQRRQGLREVLEVLLDVRDRLVRGRDSAQTALTHYPEPEGPWSIWRVKPWAGLRQAMTALGDGSDLALERLDLALRQWGVRPIECEQFDPACMKAIEVAPAPDKSDGTVLEVYRSGYTWDQQVMRLAEVKVVRNTTPSEEASHGS